eukprot:839317-Ditylum_brightwellii.AAC.1
MDHQARWCRAISDEGKSLEEVYIEGEQWTLHLDQPMSKFTHQNITPITKVSTTLVQNIKASTEGPILKEYWIEYTSIDATNLYQIDWASVAKARENFQIIKKQWASKVTADLLPTSVVVCERKLLLLPECSGNCGAKVETTGQVFSCIKNDNI